MHIQRFAFAILSFQCSLYDILFSVTIFIWLKALVRFCILLKYWNATAKYFPSTEKKKQKIYKKIEWQNYKAIPFLLNSHKVRFMFLLYFNKSFRKMKLNSNWIRDLGFWVMHKHYNGQDRRTVETLLGIIGWRRTHRAIGDVCF